MPTSAEISLGPTPVASLWTTERGVACQLDGEWLRMPNRPVLSQWYEDHLTDRARAWKVFPPWFENALPERGSLVRSRACRSLGLEDEDDLSLLLALGEGLPGNVFARSVERSVLSAAGGDDAPVDAFLRTSLGGMQLKFTLSGRPDRLALPVRGEDERQWILKVAGAAHPALASNEAAVMRWCGLAGFDVPESHVVPRAAFPDLGVLPDDVHDGYLVARFDRVGDRRIHQEDFCQVFGLRPGNKYNAACVQLARVVRQVLKGDGLTEFARRLVATVATGNGDAHLKNWSIIYADGHTARWSPLYDQVATVAYPSVPAVPGLKIGAAHHFHEVSIEHLRFVWARAGGDGPIDPIVEEVLLRLRDTAREALDGLPTLSSCLREHWRRVPLLRRMPFLEPGSG